MLTGLRRKRWNRAQKRKVEHGIISEEEAQQKIIRAHSSCSKKKAEDGIVAEEEAKSKRSSRTVEGLVNDEGTKIAVQAFPPLEETVVAEEADDGIVAEEEAKSKRSSRTEEGLVNDEETKIAEQAFSPLEETVVAQEAVKNEKRQKNSETEETNNSDNAGRPKHYVLKRPLKRQYKGEGKGGSLGVSVAPNNGTVAGDLKAESCDVAERPAREKAIPRALKANTEEDVQEMFDSGYYRFPERPFWDGVRLKDVDWGTHALWKNVPTGKNGGESTKVEYFHGEVQG